MHHGLSAAEDLHPGSPRYERSSPALQPSNFVAHSRPRMARPAFPPAAMRPRLGPKFLRAIVGQGVLHRRGLSRPRFFSAGLRRRSRVLRTRGPLYLPIFLAVDQRGFSVHMLVGAARCTPRRVFSMYKKNPRTISPRILSKPNCNRAPGAYCFVDSYFWPPTTGLVTALYYTEPMGELQEKTHREKDWRRRSVLPRQHPVCAGWTV